MTGNEYQALAMRTNDGKACRRLGRLLIDDSVDIGGILNGCLGLAGESGELLDLIKKWIFHEKVLDMEHAKKELGDVLWYCAMIAEAFDWELDEIMRMNIAKLQSRYPEGFDPVLSNHRKSGDV